MTFPTRVYINGNRFRLRLSYSHEGRGYLIEEVRFNIFYDMVDMVFKGIILLELI